MSCPTPVPRCDSPLPPLDESEERVCEECNWPLVTWGGPTSMFDPNYTMMLSVQASLFQSGDSSVVMSMLGGSSSCFARWITAASIETGAIYETMSMRPIRPFHDKCRRLFLNEVNAVGVVLAAPDISKPARRWVRVANSCQIAAPPSERNLRATKRGIDAVLKNDRNATMIEIPETVATSLVGKIDHTTVLIAQNGSAWSPLLHHDDYIVVVHRNGRILYSSNGAIFHGQSLNTTTPLLSGASEQSEVVRRGQDALCASLALPHSSGPVRNESFEMVSTPTPMDVTTLSPTIATCSGCSRRRASAEWVPYDEFDIPLMVA